MSRQQVATIGDNCIDYYIPPIGRAAVGGQALNVAVYWQRLGLMSEYIGAVGDDEDGFAVLRALRAAGVITDRVDVRPGSTGLTRFAISPEGERQIVSEDFGVCGEYAPGAEDLDHLEGFDYVHFAQLSDFRTPAVELAGRGVRVSYDFSVVTETEGLDAFDTVFYGFDGGSDDDRAIEIATAAVRGGATRAVVTLGAHGSLVADVQRLVRTQAVPVEPVDTCGAGDSFAATFLARLLDDAPLDACLQEASVAASRAVLHLGAWPQELEQRQEATA
jgi:fructoselysine 6-kinase